MKKHNYLIILLLTFTSIIGQTIHNISDPEDLSDLELVAGDVVILADGTYSSDERIKFSGPGTASNPIIFRPETPGGAVFTGGLQMDIVGSYLVVDGFYWNGGIGASNFIQFRNGTTYAEHCTIQNCAINGLVAEAGDADEALAESSVIKHRWIVLYGNYNSVLNCTFMNKNTAGALVLAEYEYNASPDEVANTRCDEVGHIISNNYFYNFQKITELYADYVNESGDLSNAGDSETIRIGTSEYQNVNSQALVSNNYFVQADGENEIITNKSMNNTYVNNTFRRSRGSLVMRHGSDAIVSGNYFLGENVEGTGGIRIADSNHQITNNYIQDCISSIEQIPWNNGLTFVGGNTNSVQDCLSTSVSNDYQDVENINFSNNTFINTHSPFYFNATRDGADNVFGDVSDNLIYFESNNANITNVINGSYTDIGNTLAFSGNVYDGASGLGETVAGFTEESITVTENGEIFTHNLTGKGASISNAPITDNMVGNGIGACFLNFEAELISDPICTIEVVEPIDSMSISSVSTFSATEGDAAVTVSANISWTAVANSDWITIDTASGDGDADLTVSVDPNPTFEIRTGSVTFTQVDGNIVRILSVSQEGMDVTSNFILINDASTSDNVTVEFAFDEEIIPANNKNNPKENALDKNFTTNWSGNGANVAGEEDDVIIFNLGGAFDLALVNFASTIGKTYEFQIWVSTTGIEKDDFENVFPNQGNLVSTTTVLDEFTNFVLPEVVEGARYVKILALGQPSTTGSAFTSITEIEFYRTDEVLSVDDFSSTEELGIVMYPNPTSGLLNISRESLDFNTIRVHTILGEEVLVLELNSRNPLTELDLSNLNAGLYFVEISNGNQKAVSRIIVAD